MNTPRWMIRLNDESRRDVHGIPAMRESLEYRIGTATIIINLFSRHIPNHDPEKTLSYHFIDRVMMRLESDIFRYDTFIWFLQRARLKHWPRTSIYSWPTLEQYNRIINQNPFMIP